MVRVRVADGVGDLGDRCEASTGAVCDENLSVREMNKLGHGTPLEHVFDFPSLRDTLGSNRDTRALRGSWELRGEVRRLDRGVHCSTAANEDFRDEIGRGEWEEDRGAVYRVGDADVVRNVRKNGLRVGLNVVYDRLVVRDHEDPTVGKGEDSTEDTVSATSRCMRNMGRTAGTD